MEIQNPPRLSYEFTNIRGDEDTVFECPCCRLPTIAEPGGYEICNICGWEDDDSFGGGPNHCSLDEAQRNFQLHQHMYDRDHSWSNKPRRNEFLATCIALLNDFKKQADHEKRGVLFEAFIIESEWL